MAQVFHCSVPTSGQTERSCLFQADLKLKFPAHEKPKKLQEVFYEKRPEIRHLFREPEKRPPVVVSDTFTVLVFIPLLLLFILVSIWVEMRSSLLLFIPFQLNSFSVAANRGKYQQLPLLHLWHRLPCRTRR